MSYFYFYRSKSAAALCQHPSVFCNGFEIFVFNNMQQNRQAEIQQEQIQQHAYLHAQSHFLELENYYTKGEMACSVLVAVWH